MTNENGNGNGDGHVPEGLSTVWLATRLGVQSARVDAMRRAGELLGVPVPNGRGYVFPGWQFGRDGMPLPALQALVRGARAEGVGDALQRALTMPLGERKERHAALMRTLRQHDIGWWRESYVDALTRAPYDFPVT